MAFKSLLVSLQLLAFGMDLSLGVLLSHNYSTPVDFAVNEAFPHQPLKVVQDAKTLEDAVDELLKAAGPSQERMINAIKAAGDKLAKDNYVVYNPGPKSKDSALRKSKDSFGSPNRVRQLTDAYRGSIVVETMDQIEAFGNEEPSEQFKSILKGNGFEIVQFKNTFKKPWTDGYRDLNMRVKDTKNGLVGEVQAHLCAVKKFTQIVGHRFYEIVREAPENEKAALQKAFDEVSSYGYEEAVKWPELKCLDELEKPDGKVPPGKYKKWFPFPSRWPGWRKAPLDTE